MQRPVKRKQVNYDEIGKLHRAGNGNALMPPTVSEEEKEEEAIGHEVKCTFDNNQKIYE
jgi:hypothetical protein